MTLYNNDLLLADIASLPAQTCTYRNPNGGCSWIDHIAVPIDAINH